MARCLVFVLVFTIVLAYVNSTTAQVTFSRDWNAGKRTNGDIQCAPSGRSVAAICHMLLAELRQAIACESRSILRSLQADDTDINPSTIFAGRQ